MEDIQLAAQLLDKDSYYKDSIFGTFSGVKVFSRCEKLYEEMFVAKTYEEPERDYFVYGKLVDAFLTEKPEFLEENFIKVERRLNPEDALKFENSIKTLTEEISKKEIEQNEKFLAKQNEISEKIRAIEEKLDPEKGYTAAQQKKLDELKAKLNEMSINRGDYLDKTLTKGIEGRKEEILGFQAKLDAIKQMADKQQVTEAVWENAESTALALKTHPYYSNMEFNEVTSQQIFVATLDGVPCKGRFDHLKLSPALTKFYAIYKANQMTLTELQERIRGMNPNDLWAIITDIKTCFSIEKLEPYNNQYRGQLGHYQDLVNAVLLIPIENIKCQIFVADKMTNNFKLAELFSYTQPALDELKPDVRAWMKLWHRAMKTKTFVSAKQKLGYDQKCFTCSECRFCPFSTKPGEAVVVSGPRFIKKGQENSVVEDFSTAQALLDY